jgi:hypothetical protein
MTLLLKVCRQASAHDGSSVDKMTPENGLAVHNRREIGIS